MPEKTTIRADEMQALNSAAAATIAAKDPAMPVLDPTVTLVVANIDWKPGDPPAWTSPPRAPYPDKRSRKAAMEEAQGELARFEAMTRHPGPPAKSMVILEVTNTYRRIGGSSD